MLLLVISANSRLLAQRTCGTVDYMNNLKNKETKESLENWILQKQIESPLGGQKSYNADGVTVYRIPVVVHVVHKGEAEGDETNISENQILSQIAVLNEDFRKLNADSINIPAEFKPLYSNIGFEFIMAKRDPNNQATNGIVRVNGGQNLWSMSEDVDLKATSYWPSEDYLNIWVAPLSGAFLGWAQFPQSDILDGLDPPYNANTDGVVITYNAFGSIAKDPAANLQPNFNLGRTVTHEVGHFFGLRHIWGDGGCGIDDYVSDTPLAEDDYTGCPTMGTSTTSCGSQDMFMNYMDYVYDDCMNIFSIGQKDRMIIIMENSPRRLSLTNSAGLLPPISKDLALTKFISPTLGICNAQVTPIIEVRNTGVLDLTSANISLYVNNVLVDNQTFNFNITVNQTVELTFNLVSLSEYGNLVFKAEINTLNGTTDENPDNNILTQTSLRAETVTGLFEDFSSDNSQWTIRTSEESSALNKEQVVFYSNVNNNAAVFNYYKTETSSDAYISPKLILEANPQKLIFDYSYAYRNLEDELYLRISSDCGNTFNDVLFSAVGESLSTSSEVPVAFYPSTAQDWQQVQVDLTSYANQEVVFSFSGNSNGGNHIFLDNIKVIDNSYNDIALIGLANPATTCSSQNEFSLWVENKGSAQLNDLSIETILGSTNSTINYPQLNLLPGERINLMLPTIDFEGSAELSVSLINDDGDNSNNSFTQTIVSQTSTTVPLREKFNANELQEGWAISRNPPNTLNWKVNNNRLEFLAENSSTKGLSELIILPPLDLSNLSSASMHFDFAYAYNGFNEELLRVKVSNDCEQPYQTLFIQGGEELATNFTTTSWLPDGNSDWKDIYVDLTEFAGNENVQIVIEVVSAKGNNAFIDNIELYASNIEFPLNLVENTITAYPNPSSNGLINISFNLQEQQPAKLLIYNAQGSFIYEEDIENALNQTFEITTAYFQNGIYFARLVGNQIDISRSFIVSQ